MPPSQPTPTADQELRIPVTGMTCQACAQAVEKALARVPGVSRAEVNYGSRTATVVRDAERVAGAQLRAAIEGAGYGVPDDAGDAVRSLEADVGFAERAEAAELRRGRRDALLALVLGAGVVLSGFLGEPGPWPFCWPRRWCSSRAGASWPAAPRPPCDGRRT